jgi:hypothetical protein
LSSCGPIPDVKGPAFESCLPLTGASETCAIFTSVSGPGIVVELEGCELGFWSRDESLRRLFSSSVLMPRKLESKNEDVELIFR